MPSVAQNQDILLDFYNDTHDCVTVQLLHDYGRNTGTIVLLHPAESVTLVLDPGSVYRYAVKTQTKVANVTCVRSRSSHSTPELISIATTTAHGLGETFVVKYHTCFLAACLVQRRCPCHSRASKLIIFGEITGFSYGMTCSSPYK